MPEELKEAQRRSQIIDPTPARRKRLTEILMQFLEDKISLAEIKGISRTDLFRLADAGFTKFKHGRIDEAEKIYQGLILLDHRNAYFHSVMGAIHQKKSRPIEAIMEYTLALKLNKNDVASHVNRGEIYLRYKNYKKAAQDFREAIISDAQGINLWANRARSLVIAIKRSLETDRASGRKRPVKVS